MKPHNPFAPTFGAAPPLLAGRETVLHEVGVAMTTGSTHPSLTSLLIGRRGSGKTAILEALRELGSGRGWLSVSDAATAPGVLDRIAHKAMEHLNRSAADIPSTVLDDLAAAGVRLGPGYEADADLSRRLANVLSGVCMWLQTKEVGLVLTVDELQAGETTELRLLGTVIQDVARIGRLPLVFAGAGLPLLEETLLTDSSVTFLQRCARYEIDFLEPHAAWAAVAQPVRQRGGAMAPDAVEHAVAESQGYPFMLQLIGYHAWESAADPTTTITLDDVVTGSEIARRQVGRLVISPMWRDLSQGSKRFLAALACQDGPSRIAEIAARLGVTSGYASVYGHRLTRSGFIASAGAGRVDLVLDAAREWIRGLDEYPLLCETLQSSSRAPVGFAPPSAAEDDTS